MKFSKRSIRELGSLIVGDPDHFRYRSSYYISELFEEAGLPQRHNGQWRPVWAGEIVEEMLASSPARPNQLPDDFVALLRGVMNKEDAEQDDPDRALALLALNVPLKREGFEAFYGDDDHLHFKHIGTQTVSAKPDPHKPFTTEEIARRAQLSTYLDSCSEDELIEEVLLPLYRQLGYHRITAAGHEDKNLEHGKDIWMRFMLPSQHMLYFGLQVKKGKLDASADSTKRDGPNTNIAVIHNQVLMMLDSPVWDPEFNSTRLATAAGVSGIACGLRIFMRLAGMFQMCAAKSNSGHFARRHSPERTAFKIVNIKASRLGVTGRLSSSLKRLGTSSYGMAT